MSLRHKGWRSLRDWLGNYFMFAINCCAFPRYLFLAAVRDSYTGVWADPTALDACMFFCSSGNSLTAAAVGLQSSSGKARSVLVCVAFSAAAAQMIQVHMTDNKSQHGSPSLTHCSHFCDLDTSMILLSIKWSWKVLVFLLKSGCFRSENKGRNSTDTSVGKWAM